MKKRLLTLMVLLVALVTGARAINQDIDDTKLPLTQDTDNYGDIFNGQGHTLTVNLTAGNGSDAMSISR